MQDLAFVLRAAFKYVERFSLCVFFVGDRKKIRATPRSAAISAKIPQAKNVKCVLSAIQIIVLPADQSLIDPKTAAISTLTETKSGAKNALRHGF